MCVAYYFLVQKYAVGNANNSTNLWVFSSCSLSDFHFEQLYDVWKGRLLAPLFSGFWFDFLVKDKSLNIEAYGNAFALYQSLWLLLLFVVVILGLRQSLLINLGIFAGLTYNFSPEGGLYFYPWDIPSTLFFTLAILFYERRQMPLMIMVICVGAFLKETILVCALLFFFVNEWKWWWRLLTFAGIGFLYMVGKKILIAHLHITAAVFSMNDSRNLSDLLHTDKLVENAHYIFSPTLNHYLFVHAGTVLAVLVLGWQRRFLPYLVVIFAHEVGLFWFADLHEFRNSMNCLPICVIILAQRWQDYTFPASLFQGLPVPKPESAGSNKVSSKSTISMPPWSVRDTFPILKLLLVLLTGTCVVISAWQYYSIIEYHRPDHQARVVEALKSKAEKGDAQAQYQLAKHYVSGEGVAGNPTNAFQWFLKAAEHGVAEAQCQLGVCYVQAVGTGKDFAASVPWFRKAADQGNVDAQYNLGLLYENGMGVKQDLAEAAIWYQRAGEKGNILAQNSLGLICVNFRKDYAEAAQWFRKAADQGNAPAQNSLGVLYLQGLGVKQDANEALKWFQQSAQLGFAEGQNNCGLVFYSGQRYNESAQWFHKAADQGHIGAQYNLAQFYQKGLAYAQDLGEASLWYSRAAKQGYGLAQLSLGKIYREGQGLKADNIEAYKWFKLAQLQDVSDAGKELANCAAAMSKEQINTAESEVKQFTAVRY